MNKTDILFCAKKKSNLVIPMWFQSWSLGEMEFGLEHHMMLRLRWQTRRGLRVHTSEESALPALSTAYINPQKRTLPESVCKAQELPQPFLSLCCTADALDEIQAEGVTAQWKGKIWG